MPFSTRKLSLALDPSNFGSREVLAAYEGQVDLITLVPLGSGVFRESASPSPAVPWRVCIDCESWTQVADDVRLMLEREEQPAFCGFEFRLLGKNGLSQESEETLRELLARIKMRGKQALLRVPLDAEGIGIDATPPALDFDGVIIEAFFPAGGGENGALRLGDGGIGAPMVQPRLEQLLQKWTAALPDEKLTVELPTFSYCYSVRPGECGRVVPASIPSDLPGEFEKSWLWFEKVHLYRYEAKGAGTQLFYACDAQSTQALLETVADFGISSISFSSVCLPEPSMWEAALMWRQG